MSEMASEIDEAAAVEWFEWYLKDVPPVGPAFNACRAALAWKARAEKWDALIRPESILPLQRRAR